MATKPIIATPRGEYDARALVQGDLSIVSTWPDVSPFGTNALSLSQGEPRYQAVGGAGTPWSATLPAVRVDDSGPSLVNWSFPTVFGTVGFPCTLFVVCQATDIAQSGMAFWGTTDGINPVVGVYLFIAPDGSVWFIMGANGGVSGTRIISEAGLVSPGDRLIITARRAGTPQSPGVSSGPMILRVNGVEVASSLGSAWTDFWFSPRMHRANLPSTGGFPGSIDGHDGLYAHLLAFGSEASDAEIVQMEEWLAEIWGFNFGTTWIPEPLPTLPEPVFPPAPKPTGLAKPITEFDVRNLRDDPQYQDGDSLVVSQGGVGWKDLAIIGDPQGRTDADLNTVGNVFFVENGWNEKRGIDAVRFVGFPVEAPTNPEGSHLPWEGGGIVGQNWAGNEYTYIGVMRCTDISQHACLFGGTSGIIPNAPKKSTVWVQPDGSVAVHHTDEETSGAVQPGSSYSLESAPGIVEAGDSVIITVTASASLGKVLRVNGKVVASNPFAFSTYFTESSAPTIGAGFPEQLGPGVGAVGGLDRLIVYLATFGSLLTDEQIEEYEAFLALTFQVSVGTEWAFEPPPVPLEETVWGGDFPAPPQPVLPNQVIQLDARFEPIPDPPLDPPGAPNRFGEWTDQSPLNLTVRGFVPPPTWQPQGWDPNGRRLGVVDMSGNDQHFNIIEGGAATLYPGNFVTLFFVAEATDFSDGGLVLIGGNQGGGGGNLRNMNVVIGTDGSVSFNFFDTGSGINDTVSAPGFVAEGERFYLTCQHWAAGRTIRLNGTVIATSTGTSHLITYPTPFIGNLLGFHGEQKKLAWYSGHNVELTDAQVLEMEAFLRGAFFTPDPPPPTGWAP